MKKKIDIVSLDKTEYSLLNKYIGQGKLDSPIIFFGNEPGMSGMGIEETLEYLKVEEDHINIPGSNGFLLNESYTHPTTSDFVRFIARFMLALKYNESRFFRDLSPEGISKVNAHIMSPMKDKNYTLINLRPLPRPTEDTWIYSNINKKDYNRKYNFCLKNHYSDNLKYERMYIFKNFFIQSVHSIIIGVGDKENKKKFFESIFDDCNFYKIKTGNISLYVDFKKKILLSNYFNNRNGIKISGLSDLYKFIKTLWNIPELK